MDRRTARILGRGLAVLIVAVAVWLSRGTGTDTPSAPPASSDFETALREERSGVWLEVEAPIVKVLDDDRHPPRHQRILLDMGRRRTLLLTHNIDLAPRVPASAGDVLRIRGRFEWNKKGGVIHWTHHDPQGRKPGGWVDLDGERYR